MYKLFLGVAAFVLGIGVAGLVLLPERVTVRAAETPASVTQTEDAVPFTAGSMYTIVTATDQRRQGVTVEEVRGDWIRVFNGRTGPAKWINTEQIVTAEFVK